MNLKQASAVVIQMITLVAAQPPQTTTLHPDLMAPGPEEVEVPFNRPCPECELEQMVLQNASKVYPPRTRSGKPVTVDTKLVVSELIDMNVRTETLTIHATVRMMWFDEYVKWKPEKFANIIEIRLAQHKVWLPDIRIENGVDQSHVLPLDHQLHVVVAYFGLHYWAVPLVIRSKCRTDVTYFPFDEQKCRIKLNSWTYTNRLMNYVLSDYDSGMESPVSNIEWDITAITPFFFQNVMTTPHPLYPNDPNISYPYIEYELNLVRKPNFYVNLLVVPSFVISWLGAVIYLIPNASGEKLGFSITLFLALYVNQVIVSEFLPPSADSFPLIARFYMIISFMLAFSVVPTVFTLTLHFKIIQNFEPNNSVFHKVLTWFEKLGSCSSFSLFRCAFNSNCCVSNSTESHAVVLEGFPNHTFGRTPSMRQKPGQKRSRGEKHPVFSSAGGKRHSGGSLENGGGKAVTESHGNKRLDSHCDSIIDEEDCSKSQSPLEVSVERVLMKLEELCKEDESERLMVRWQIIATGVDKLCFVVYCIVLIGITALFACFLWFRNYPGEFNTYPF